jgi:hypothetical protein
MRDQMRAAERVRSIRRIRDLAGQLEWDEIDLMLEQFGLRTHPVWSGTAAAYVLDIVSDAPDDTLTELLSFLQSEAEGGGADSSELPWLPGYFCLFGSHLAEDKVVLAKVKTELRKWAIGLFVAHQDIKPSKAWMDEIDLALATCDALGAFLTPTFHESPWTDQEVGIAIARRVLIVPICLGLMPYGFMGRYQGLPADGQSPATLAEALFHTLLTNPTTSGRMAEAITSYICDATSFSQAIRGSELLVHVKNWPPILLRRLEKSLSSNSQVGGAFRVPDRIRRLTSRYAKK